MASVLVDWLSAKSDIFMFWVEQCRPLKSEMNFHKSCSAAWLLLAHVTKVAQWFEVRIPAATNITRPELSNGGGPALSEVA